MSSTLNEQVQEFLFEKHGRVDLDTCRQRLFEDLKRACGDIYETVIVDENLTVHEFVGLIFGESSLSKVFWLNIKRHFIGNDSIVNFINTRCKSLNVFHLDFLRDLYWTMESQYSTNKVEIHDLETDQIRNGIIGEEYLLQHLNESDENFYYMPSGKLVLHSIPCVAATPDLLILERSSLPERLSKMYEYVSRAKGIGEVKTTMLPENFYVRDKDTFSESDLHQLLQKVYKNRHFLSSENNTKPTVYTVTKGKCLPRVNWLTRILVKELAETFERTCEIHVRDLQYNNSYRFDFSNLTKKVYINFLTSPRGKQLLGQCLVFRDNNLKMTDVEVHAFYLFLSRDDAMKPEYYVEVKCIVPKSVLQYIELELNKKFYSEFYETCITASK